MKIKKKNNQKAYQRSWKSFVINKQSLDSKPEKYILIGRGWQNQEKKK